MPTCFRTSSDFPVGLGPTGGCAYCAPTGEVKSKKAKGKSKDMNDARVILAASPAPSFCLSPLTAPSITSTSCLAFKLLPFDLLMRLFLRRFVRACGRRLALLRLLLLRLLGRVLLQVAVYGVVDRDADGAGLLVGPAAVLKLALPLALNDRVFRLRLRHAFGLALVREVVSHAVVGRDAVAGRELEPRLGRQALLLLSRERRGLQLLRLLAREEVLEHDEHHQADDYREQRQAADEPEQRPYGNVRLLVRHVRVRDVRHVRRLVYAVALASTVSHKTS